MIRIASIFRVVHFLIPLESRDKDKQGSSRSQTLAFYLLDIEEQNCPRSFKSKSKDFLKHLNKKFQNRGRGKNERKTINSILFSKSKSN